MVIEAVKAASTLWWHCASFANLLLPSYLSCFTVRDSARYSSHDSCGTFQHCFFFNTSEFFLTSAVRLWRPLSLQVQRRLTCNGLTIRILCGQLAMLTVVVVLLGVVVVVVVLFVVVAVIVVACQLANCKLRLACLHMK